MKISFIERTKKKLFPLVLFVEHSVVQLCVYIIPETMINYLKSIYLQYQII